jgi:hypothetical protein
VLKAKLSKLLDSIPDGSDVRIGNREPDIWLEKSNNGYVLREANLATEFAQMRQERLRDLDSLKAQLKKTEAELEDIERMHSTYVPDTATSVDLELFSS